MVRTSTGWGHGRVCDRAMRSGLGAADHDPVVGSIVGAVGKVVIDLPLRTRLAPATPNCVKVHLEIR